MEDKYGFFVGIKDPVSVRRSILECTKDIVRNLQKYEQFRKTREEKIKKIIELKHVFEEIDKLNADLKAEFPKADLKLDVFERAPVKERKSIKEPKPEKISKKQLGEIEKLEEELSLIENRLNRLSG